MSIILDCRLEIPFNFMKMEFQLRRLVIAKAAVTSNEMTLTGGGSNIATDVGGPKIYMSENKFKEIYETPTLYGFFFDVEEQYQQDMENYLMRTPMFPITLFQR